MALWQHNRSSAKKFKKRGVTQSPTTDLRCRSRVRYQPCTGLLWVNGCLDRHRRLSLTPVEKLQLLETFKNKLGHAGGRGYRFDKVRS